MSFDVTLSAELLEPTRAGAASRIVEVRWSATCGGVTSEPNYFGTLYLVDEDTGERIFQGGAGGSGTSTRAFQLRESPRRIYPELTLSCSEGQAPFHSAGGEAKRGNTVVIPALGDDDDRRSGGGGGGTGRGPRDPLRPGGCSNVIRGTNGRDTLRGTGGGDLIFGLGGADVIRARQGHDCLIGGRGADRLYGGPGADRLTGGAGDDVLVGGADANSYDAGPGDDFVNAVNARRELVRCGPGRDRARVDRFDRVRGCETVVRVGGR